MLKSNIQDALNDQMNAEMASAYLYLSMAAHFESRSLRGMAHWMKVQAGEEWRHAMKFFQQIVDRGGHVSFLPLGAPKEKWSSVQDAFQDALNHECQVTGRIHGLVKLAASEADFATHAFLQWFVNEQVEEEANAQIIVEKLKMMGDGNVGLLFLDSELGKRAGD
ncbi:MAG: ferritin [Thermoguttaceae bacterium]|jgi:ferritin